jgi:hypothetical protein
MPLKLSTTIGKIQNIPNPKNIEVINEFLEYMKNNGSSEHHRKLKNHLNLDKYLQSYVYKSLIKSI